MIEAITERPTGLTRAAVEELSRRRGEPDWLRQLRLEAFEAYEAAPVPDQRTEGWRRTSLAGLDLVEQHVLVEGQAAAETPAPAEGFAGSYEQRNGTPGVARLLPEAEQRGVRILSLAEAVNDEALGQRVRAHFGQVVRPGADKFTALHYAFLNAGVVVYVPRGVALEQPVHVRQTFTEPGLAAFSHLLLIAEESAEVALLDEYRSEQREGAPLASGVVELVLGDGAQVRYVHLQNWAEDVWSFSWQAARLGNDAHLRTLNAALGARTARNTVQVQLLGKGGQVDLLGVAMLDGRQHVDFETLQEHTGSSTRSDLMFHHALRGRASSNFTGLIRINKDSRHTESNQEQKNVLLSRQAKADSDPKLEILNNDVVRCTHGAAVGPVDPDLLFYLQSRGLPREDAEHLLIEGFFQSVLAILHAPVLQEHVWTAVRRKFDA